MYKPIYVISYRLDNICDYVAQGSLVEFVNNMIDEERICDSTIEDFTKEHGHKPETEQEAIELLETDGYDVEEDAVFEK